MPERKLFDVAQRWARLILSFRRRGAGGYYLAFARIGLLLALAGLAPWFPSVKQQILEWLVDRAFEQADQSASGTAVRQPNIVAWQIGISTLCLLSGFVIIFAALARFDRANSRKRPGEENNDFISLLVPTGATLEGLVSSTAKVYGTTVKLDEIPEKIAKLPLSAGPLHALNFSDFLNQVSARTSPPKQVSWREEGDRFFVAQTP